jgi:hypothetical protein
LFPAYLGSVRSPVLRRLFEGPNRLMGWEPHGDYYVTLRKILWQANVSGMFTERKRRVRLHCEHSFTRPLNKLHGLPASLTCSAVFHFSANGEIINTLYLVYIAIVKRNILCGFFVIVLIAVIEWQYKA